MKESKVTLVVLSDESHGTEIEAKARSFEPGWIVFKNIEAFTHSKGVITEKSFDQEYIFLQGEAQLDQPTINSLVKVLKPGCQLVLHSKTPELEAGLQKRLHLAGLTDIQTQSDGVFSLVRKVWKQESKKESAPVELQPKNAFAAALAQRNPEEKIDAEALLKDDQLTEGDKGGSCETKPKACKNCTCGRKEME